jgi:hypothetical protein
MQRINFHCNIDHELKCIRMKTRRIWVGYMIKLIIPVTWVSKLFHLKRYDHNYQNGVSSRKKVNAYCGFTSLGLRLQYKGDIIQCLKGNHKQNCRFKSGIYCLIRLAAIVKENYRVGTSHRRSGEVLVTSAHSPSKSTGARCPTIEHATYNIA